jgi:hypothetical protein
VSDTPRQTLAIEALVHGQCKELGMTPVELVRRCGYQNVSKGLRRLEKLCTGDFKRSGGLVQKLPAALEVPMDVVKEAVEATERYLRESAEAAWRAAFRPHAIIMTERKRPEPLFVAAFIGVDVLLRVDLDLTAAPVTFVKQALKGLHTKLARWRFGALPAFGRPVGIIVNYSPDRAIRFDLEGTPVELFDVAYRPGDIQLFIGRRPVSHAELATIFSGR